MPAMEREIVLRWIASTVASRYLRASVVRVAAWDMDMLARLSLLEGAAGVSPGTWLRQRERGFGAALDHFGPKLAAAWTTSRAQGLYDKAISAAARSLRNVSGTDAIDLVQDMMSGSTSSSGPARTRIFYAVGNALRKDESAMVSGMMTPDNRRVLGTIENWVSRAARDVVQSAKERRQKWQHPDEHGVVDPFKTQKVQELDDEERTNLLLLALQSPGGPGNEVRRIIDHEIDRSFRPSARPIVRAFLEKIGQPKYRSPQEMKRLVSRFTPAKWFTQAYNLVRREIMEEQGVTPQQLTNVLGSNASKVFRFMREKVGRNPRVNRIIEELAEEIEMLEPVVSRVAKANLDETSKLRNSVMRRWLENKEREANLSSGNAFATGPEDLELGRGTLDGEFEMNEHMDWDGQTDPLAGYGRGAVPLRVASAWVEAREQ